MTQIQPLTKQTMALKKLLLFSTLIVVPMSVWSQETDNSQSSNNTETSQAKKREK